jgi:hypothetical protein
MIKYYKAVRFKKYYAFDSDILGNYGVGYSKEEARENLIYRQEIKDNVLKDLNNYNIFSQEKREYISGLISRNWKEILKAIGEKKC